MRVVHSVPQLEEVDDDVALRAAPHTGVGGEQDPHESGS